MSPEDGESSADEMKNRLIEVMIDVALGAVKGCRWVAEVLVPIWLLILARRVTEG